MQTRYPVPDDEHARLAALAEFARGAEADADVFAAAAQLAATICSAPVALVGMVDHDVQWFTAAVGRDTTPTPRESTFCTHAILGDAVLEVDDALADPRFRDNPLVVAEPGIRFYAGVPLNNREEGSAIGTLCVVDFHPRRLDPHQRVALEQLGTMLNHLLQARQGWLREHEAQRETERRLRTIADNVPAAICYIDAERRYRFNNRWYAKWLDRPIAEITGREVDVVHGEFQQAAIAPYLERALAGHSVQFEIELPRRGQTRYLRGSYVPDLDADGRCRGVYGLTSDATELKRAEQQLEHMARFDALTGLPNRHSLRIQLEASAERARRGGGLRALLFLDIDRFKSINDGHGHEVGDRVLREFARRLKQSVRGSDTAARLAGDEFVVLLEALGQASEADAVASKILQAMATPFELDGVTLGVGTSIGIAVATPDEADVDGLLRRADHALYAAKAAGRGTFRREASAP